MQTFVIVMSLSLALLIAPGSLHPLVSQELPPVELHGRVVDDGTDAPIAGARVIVRAPWGQRLATRVTDEFGRFNLEVHRAPAVRLRAERIGYREATTPFLHFDDRQYFELEIRLDEDAVLLAPLEVVAHSEVRRSPVLANFDHRVRSGFGSYFERADIERIAPGRVTDLLARLPGVRLESSGSGTSRIVDIPRNVRLHGPCPVQVFVDGRLMSRAGDISIDDVVTPADVEGVEVYRGLSGVPPEFLNSDARCGVVAVWTRRGG